MGLVGASPSAYQEAALPMGAAVSDPSGNPAARPLGAPSAVMMGSDVSANVMQPGVLTNGPAPDALENRQMYGRAMSGAGRRSAAAGD